VSPFLRSAMPISGSIYGWLRRIPRLRNGSQALFPCTM
jgi:hypothetical protein